MVFPIIPSLLLTHRALDVGGIEFVRLRRRASFGDLRFCADKIPRSGVSISQRPTEELDSLAQQSIARGIWKISGVAEPIPGSASGRSVTPARDARQGKCGRPTHTSFGTTIAVLFGKVREMFGDTFGDTFSSIPVRSDAV